MTFDCNAEPALPWPSAISIYCQDRGERGVFQGRRASEVDVCTRSNVQQCSPCLRNFVTVALVLLLVFRKIPGRSHPLPRNVHTDRQILVAAEAFLYKLYLPGHFIVRVYLYPSPLGAPTFHLSTSIRRSLPHGCEDGSS